MTASLCVLGGGAVRECSNIPVKAPSHSCGALSQRVAHVPHSCTLTPSIRTYVCSEKSSGSLCCPTTLSASRRRPGLLASGGSQTPALQSPLRSWELSEAGHKHWWHPVALTLLSAAHRVLCESVGAGRALTSLLRFP